jgi:eukaryotic-like serine/threonine-protein kinase
LDDLAGEIAALVAQGGSPEELQRRVAELLAAHGLASTHHRGSVRVPVDLTRSAATWSELGRDDATTEEISVLTDRYELLGTLGRGGMGTVRRARDVQLNRVVALKSIHPNPDPLARTRFLAEAQVTAQLQHPNIVPAYDVGQLPNGSLYYTMKLVAGRTLAAMILMLHVRQRGTDSHAGVTMHQLLRVFHRTTEAMAYAHARGVVHRDLKPSNIMVGDFGETLVVDWGLAKVLGDAPETQAVRTTRSTDDSMNTQVGTVTGTPAYLAPELTTGEVHRVTLASDVYSLGAILYEILCGQPPYSGSNKHQVLARAVLGAAPEPDSRTNRQLDTELVALCAASMARDPRRRLRDAGVLSERMGAWLEGTRRRTAALAEVDVADALEARARSLADDAAGNERQAAEILDRTHSHEPVERKRPGWRHQDEAAKLRRQIRVVTQERLQHLTQALNLVADLPEAHHRLGDIYRKRHAEAEAARDHALAAELEVLLRAHDTGVHAAYLARSATLSLQTDPQGGEALLFDLVEEDRRLVPRFHRSLGPTPLVEVPIESGSQLLLLRFPGRPDVRYPLCPRREEHWDGRAPNGHTVPIVLPGELREGALYVPAGETTLGGDTDALGAGVRRRVWVDAFHIQQHPVTNEQYLAFLNDLVLRGGDPSRWEPRQPGSAGSLGAPVYGRDIDGRYGLQPDVDGDLWQPRYPVLLVTVACARRYARWLSDRSGLAWRLPTSAEWEKAARGVDGRHFPWGDFLDPNWCCHRSSHQERPLPATVDDYPGDVSIYGVRGMAGNAIELCDDAYDEATANNPEAPRVGKGTGWHMTARAARCAARHLIGDGYRSQAVGFRLVHS